MIILLRHPGGLYSFPRRGALKKFARVASLPYICGLGVTGNTAVSKTARSGFDSQEVMPILRGRPGRGDGRQMCERGVRLPPVSGFDSRVRLVARVHLTSGNSRMGDARS